MAAVSRRAQGRQATLKKLDRVAQGQGRRGAPNNPRWQQKLSDRRIAMNDPQRSFQKPIVAFT
jgi:hypothetical protein